MLINLLAASKKPLKKRNHNITLPIYHHLPSTQILFSNTFLHPLFHLRFAPFSLSYPPTTPTFSPNHTHADTQPHPHTTFHTHLLTKLIFTILLTPTKNSTHPFPPKTTSDEDGWAVLKRGVHASSKYLIFEKAMSYHEGVFVGVFVCMSVCVFVCMAVDVSVVSA